MTGLGPLVKVEWVDVAGGAKYGWRPLSKVRAIAGEKAVSVGFLISETDQSIVILPHVVPGMKLGDGEIVIPKSWTTSITHLVAISPQPQKVKKCRKSPARSRSR